MSNTTAPFHIVLHSPEIPGNTGSIGRTCVALNIPLILIRPYGFSLSEKAVRRAGLDYWKFVDLREYDDFDEFLQKEKPQQRQLFFFSRFAQKIYYDASYVAGSYLIFGSESIGLPAALTKRYPQELYLIPTASDKIRSLNLANAATAAAFEAYRHLIHLS